VVVEAYVKGVSTRKVDDLVRALGIDGISRSEVSRICKVLDEEVRGFLGRPIDQECPYVWLDATFHKVREVGRVISVATVVAIGVTGTGERMVLGAQTGPSEDHQFWVTFLRSLVKRGLKGVRLVISDAHEGLRQAIAKVLHEVSWQRCRVHFMRNLLSTVPAQAQDAVAAIVRTVFSQPDHASAIAQLHDVAQMLQDRFRQAAELLEGRFGGRPGPPALPTRAPPPAAFDEPARAAAQGDQATHKGRRDLPDAGLTHADGRDAARRARRRVASDGSPLLQPGIDDEGGRTGGR
jgi:transposase-like protein